MAGRVDYNFYRAVNVEYPAIAEALLSKIKTCKESSLTDMSSVPLVFLLFCRQQKIEPKIVTARAIRTKNDIITHRRLFVAVALTLYDQIYLSDYSEKIAYMLRSGIAAELNCKEEWVSQVSPYVRHDIKKLKGYREQVNTIANYIKKVLEV